MTPCCFRRFQDSGEECAHNCWVWALGAHICVGSRAEKRPFPGHLYCLGGLGCLALAEVIMQGEVGKHDGKRLTEIKFSFNSKM